LSDHRSIMQKETRAARGAFLAAVLAVLTVAAASAQQPDPDRLLLTPAPLGAAPTKFAPAVSFWQRGGWIGPVSPPDASGRTARGPGAPAIERAGAGGRYGQIGGSFHGSGTTFAAPADQPVDFNRLAIGNYALGIEGARNNAGSGSFGPGGLSPDAWDQPSDPTLASNRHKPVAPYLGLSLTAPY